MHSTPPYPIGPGQRALAAIVFTDAVNFSRRVHQQEVATLQLLENDFEIMRGLCDRHAGTVLKSTGDGLLLYFTSAVQALGCALQMQQQFAGRARNSPANENLTHRVGIHLGDIFVKEQDVMGDGVNIASRLQALADPGGICISQTVYDVVKNKMNLEVVRLTRELKNITDSAAIYRVLLEPPPARSAAEPPPAYVPPPAPPARPAAARKLAGAALAAVLAAGLGWVAWRAQQRHEEELMSSRATQAELGALLAAKGNNPLDAPAPAATPATAPAAGQIPVLMTWLDRALVRYTRDQPLQLQVLPGTVSHETKLFADAEHRLYFAEGGAVRSRALADLKPEMLAAVIVSALHDSPAPPPREVQLGAEEFAHKHGLKEMAGVLRDRAGAR